MAHIKGCVHASVATQLPAGGHLALRVSGHSRAGVSADVPQALPGLRSLAASLSANSLARCQLPAAPGRRSAGLSCCNGIASPSASQLLAACQQAFATSALSPSQRQRRQRQVARSAAAAVLEQEPAVEADDSTVPGGSAQPSTTHYVVVNFYHLTDVSDPQQVYRQHRAALNGLDVRGRIYISPQGINAQYSGPEADAVQYAQWVERQPEFQGLRWAQSPVQCNDHSAVHRLRRACRKKRPLANRIALSTQGLRWTRAPVQQHMFNRLRLAARPHLVSLAGGTAHLPITDPAARAKPLQPAEWKQMLLGAQRRDMPSAANASADAPQDMQPATAQLGREESSAAAAGAAEGSRTGSGSWRSLGGGGQPPAAAAYQHSNNGGVVVLDVRNGYEWDAGHFQGAERPSEDQFRETPAGANGAPLPGALQGADPDTPVMMYCTGGIRCDIYSTYLRSQGFNNLYTLEGGVHNYLRQEGGNAWNGSLFVFDDRLAVPAAHKGEGGEGRSLPAAVGCQLCGGPHAELPHLNCANLDCARLFVACPACKERMRGCCCEACISAPRLLRPAMTDGSYGRVTEYFDAEQLAKLREGRGEGRLIRRRRWQEKVRVRREAHRQQRAADKAAARAAAAQRLSIGSGDDGDGAKVAHGQEEVAVQE